MSYIEGFSRADRKRVRKHLKKESAKWPATLVDIPSDEWPEISMQQPPFRVLRSNRFLVQVFNEGNHVFRLSVCRSFIEPNGAWSDKISWEELQDVKQQAGYGESQAVEIYPADSDVVNVANMRHLWVLPEPLPFGWSA